SCLLSTASYGEMDVIFSPDTDIRKLLVESINSCSSRLDIAISNLDSGELAQALTEARARGVNVRIVIDYRRARSKSSLAAFLKEEGFLIKARKGKAGGHMNNNFAIFDDKRLITGTYGWTNLARKYSHENVVLIEEPSVISSYRTEFDRLYGEEDHLVWATPEPGPVKETTKPERLIEVPRGRIPSPKEVPFPELVYGDREFIEVTIEELDEVFGPQSTLSRKEKNTLWEERYKGKYVRWHSVIVYKGITRFDWYKMGLGFDIGGKAEVLVFFKPEYQSRIMFLKEGDVIAYTARFDKKRGFGALYRLDDGDILGKLMKKTPGR
ncbi:MAG: phospholipase D-like domain-containing protein, partial [Candidatus Brocadiales bacterium]